MLLLSYVEDPVFDNRWMFSKLIRFIMECECSTLEGRTQLSTHPNLEIDDSLIDSVIPQNSAYTLYRVVPIFTDDLLTTFLELLYLLQKWSHGTMQGTNSTV